MNQRYYWRVFSSSPLSRFRASTSVVSVCIPAAEERYFSINATTAAGSLATTDTLLPQIIGPELWPSAREE